jgi:pimeloyl-ACP methyl ester carboxylesterase
VAEETAAATERPGNRVVAMFKQLTLVVILLAMSGCARLLADRMVRAPNQKLTPDERTDATEERLRELHVTEQLRIPVGPPAATLSVWMIDPVPTRETIELVRVNRRLEARIYREAATQPLSTQPAAVKGTIFLLHGIEDNKEKGPYVLYREMIARAGYRVIQLDFRGHGRSTGDWMTYGAVESHDMVQVLDALQSMGLIEGRVGVLGVSYGASVGIMWAGIDPRVKAVIALEPYCTLRDAAHDAADWVLGKSRWLFSDSDIQDCVNAAGEIAGFDPDQVSPLRAITQTSAPILLIHSRADELVPYTHSVRLHQAAPGHSRLILVDGQSHFDMWLRSLDMIRAASLAWLDRNIARTELSAN